MIEVINFRESKSRGYLTLTLDTDKERVSLTVSESEYSRLGAPLRGDKIDTDTYLELKKADELYRARRAALRILAYADNSERRLYEKLLGRGISSGTAREVSREMVMRGYIDESRQLGRLILKEALERKISGAPLFARLMSKGYSRSDIEIGIDSLVESGELDFSLIREELIRTAREGGATDEEIRRLLYKSGFSGGDG